MAVETIMNVMLVRFAIIAAIVAVAAIVLFAIALVLRRRGRLASGAKAVGPVVKRLLDARVDQVRSRSGPSRATVTAAAAAAVGDYLERAAQTDADARPARSRPGDRAAERHPVGSRRDVDGAHAGPRGNKGYGQ